MAEQVKNNNLPLKDSVFGLLEERAGRKERIEQFINDLAVKYPSLKDRVKQFWDDEDNKSDFNNLKETSPDNDFKQFFNKFNHEEDFIELLSPIILKEIEQVLIINNSDSEIIKDLKLITQEQEHKENLPLFFDDKTGGATWYIFLLDLIKDFYLNYLPSYVDNKLNENSVKLSELDKEQWKKTLNELYSDIYSTFTLTEEEKDFDNLKVELNDDLFNIKDLIKDRKIEKQWIAIKALVKKIDELSPYYPTPPPSPKPNEEEKPAEEQKPKPTPTPEPEKPKPVEPVKPTPEELAAQELQSLKDDINKLPLNATEKQVLNDAKDKLSAEAVRTQHKQRIKTEQEQKEEIVKYDNLFNNIKSETDLTKLGDGGDFDNAIKKLKSELLPSDKQPSHLQDERKLKLKQLQNIQKTKEETAKAQQVLKTINGATDPANLPDDSKIKSSYEEDLLDDELKYSELIKARDNKRTELLTAQALANFINLLAEIQATTDISKLPTDQQIKDRYNDALLEGNRKYANVITTRENKRTELLKAIELKKYNDLLIEINDENKKTFKDLPENFKETEIANLDNSLLPADKQKETLTARIKERRATFFYSLNEPKDGGLKPDELTTALNSIKEDNVWKAEEKKPITIEILNELLELEQPDPSTVQDLTDYFVSQGGYELGEDVKAEEATFTGENAWKSGGAILRDCYKRINWKPDDPTFPADLPFPTSSGKTTRVPACLLGSSKEREDRDTFHIIIISPTAAMAQDAYNHHSDWLQYEDWVKGIKWRCPYHLRDHGGDYATAKNDLTYYDTETYSEVPSSKDPKKTIIKPTRQKGNGEQGINVMEPWCIAVFLAREVININKIKCSVGVDKDNIEKGKLIVKEKLINKENTIIFFDESHFSKGGSTTYQKIQELAEKLGYKTIRATATFPKRPFSISMPKKGERKYMSGLVPKYKDNDGNEVDVNKILAEGKSLVFLPKAELSDKQTQILKRENVGYLVLDETLELASTGLSYGAPNGYVLFGDDRYSMGFSFLIRLCFSVVEIELKKLTKDWYYKGSIQPSSMASLTQQSGRVRRLIEGIFIAATKRKPTDPDFIKDIDPADDLASMMVEAVLNGDVSKLSTIYPSLINIGGTKKDPSPLLIQAAIALPFADGKGRYPEEILIGLTKGGAGADLYPKFGIQKKPASADADLWARFEGNYKPKEIDKTQAEQLLFLMIGNMISNQKQFPNAITLNLENPLISQAGFIEKDPSKKKQSPTYEDAIAKVRKVIYGAIATKIKDPSKIKYNNEKEFNAIVELLQLALNNDKINIEIVREETDKLKNPKNPAEGKIMKDNLTLKINYTKP